MKLPNMSSAAHYAPFVQEKFFGINHNYAASDGEIYDMMNLSSKEYPLLSPRVRRGVLRTLFDPNGIGAKDYPYWVDGTSFYYNGEYKGSVEDSRKVFAELGTKVCIFPDKAFYDTEADSFGSLESKWEGTSLSFQNGLIYGAAANANTIYASGAGWSSYFSEGDAVKIEGCTTHPENNKTPIVREVSGDYLRFYENVFTLDVNAWKYIAGENGLPTGTYHFTIAEVTRQFTVSADLAQNDTLDWNGTTLTATIGGSTSTISTTLGTDGSNLTFLEVTTNYTETGTLSISRDVPDLDWVCVNENRLWGCKKDTIYASKLGDPTNFNVFDGLSTDSWASDTVDAGDFTGCVSYLGYPIFFKEDSVYKVYGDKPSNFQWTPGANLGVMEGSGRSIAIAGETLFYLSRAGICAYNGGNPAVISTPLGANTKFWNAVGGSDGIRYYVSMSDGTEYSVYCYDTRYQQWYREDPVEALDFAFWDDGLVMLTKDGEMLRLDGLAGEEEAYLPWMCETADFTGFNSSNGNKSPNKKGVLRLQLRFELFANSELCLFIQYDSDGMWRQVKNFCPAEKKSYNIPLVLRRCDHFRLKLDGLGECIIYSIAVMRYSGSNLQ